MKNIIRKVKNSNLSITFVSNFLENILRIISIPLFISVLPVESYGQFSLSYLIMTTFATIGLLGFGIGFQRFYPAYELEGDNDRFQNTFLTFVLMTSILASVLFFMFGVTIFNLINMPADFNLVGVLSLFAFIQIWYLAIIYYLNGKEQFKELAMFRITAGILSNILAIVFVLFFEVKGIFIGYTIGFFIAFIGVIIRKHIYFRFNLDKKIMIKLIRFGLPSLGTQIVFQLMRSTDRYIIQIFLGLTAVGYYSFAIDIISAITLFLVNPVLTIFYPKVARLYEKLFITQLKSVFQKFSGVIFITIIICGTIVFSLLDFILNILNKSDYVLIKEYFLILVLSFAFFGMSRCLIYIFSIMERPILSTYTSIGSVLISVTSSIWLMKYFQIKGVAIGSTLGNIFLVAISFIYMLKVLKEKNNGEHSIPKRI
jgi:O-antigen/teichoic acid export membrane protein